MGTQALSAATAATMPATANVLFFMYVSPLMTMPMTPRSAPRTTASPLPDSYIARCPYTPSAHGGFHRVMGCSALLCRGMTTRLLGSVGCHHHYSHLCAVTAHAMSLCASCV